MKFTVNGIDYLVIIVEDLDEDRIGETDYSNNEVRIKKGIKARMLQTFIHELMHIWLFEFGHNQNDRTFTNEDICEIIPGALPCILPIIEQFIKEVILC